MLYNDKLLAENNHIRAIERQIVPSGVEKSEILLQQDDILVVLVATSSGYFLLNQRDEKTDDNILFAPRYYIQGNMSLMTFALNSIVTDYELDLDSLINVMEISGITTVSDSVSGSVRYCVVEVDDDVKLNASLTHYSMVDFGKNINNFDSLTLAGMMRVCFLD